MNKRCVLYIPVFAAILAVTSCTTKSMLRLEKLSASTLENDFLPTIAAIKKSPKLYGNNNLFLYTMDIGILYHYAGVYDSSIVYLQKGATIFDDLFARSVTNEAASIMVNDNIRPYRSKPYELSMLHQVLASDYFAIDNVDDALVEAKRAQLLFDEWSRKDKKDKKYTSDASLQYLTSILYDAADETSDAMIALFDAVRAFEKSSIALPQELQDYAYAMLQLNDRQSDVDLLGLSSDKQPEQVPGVKNGASEIVFIGYAGRAPALVESAWSGTWVKDGVMVLHHRGPNGEDETMTLPAPGLPVSELRKAENGQRTESGTTFHVKFALPALQTFPSITSSFSVSCAGKTGIYTSYVINDIEKQAKRYLEDTRATTLTRTIARVVLRTITAEKAKSRMQTSSGMANLLLNVGTDLLADQLEKADTRSCFLLPKTVQIARIPVEPGTYSVDVAARGADKSVISTKTFSSITVKPHQKKIIFYSSFK